MVYFKQGSFKDVFKDDLEFTSWIYSVIDKHVSKEVEKRLHDIASSHLDNFLIKNKVEDAVERKIEQAFFKRACDEVNASEDFSIVNKVDYY
tara:strand:- start:204 stop:479 length:276 start_codon:yes stop_codon:yes gene_type:complete